MISFLRGILLEKAAPSLVIETNGIGYDIQMPLNNFHCLPQIGQEVSLHIHFVTREDGQFLYGFLDKEQRSLFRSLIKVNGVGPKMALAILSSMEPTIFTHNILNDDHSALERIPGVGAKTARRLVVEMRDKINELQGANMFTANKVNNAANDAIRALVALGYKQQEACKILVKHKDKELPSEELIKLALKEIG
jgi:holliday junction DNA helicase RuvA